VVVFATVHGIGKFERVLTTIEIDEREPQVTTEPGA
jgi:hypothetical protein